MLPKTDQQDLWRLYNIISEYYDSMNRSYSIFESRYSKDEDDGYPGYFVRWLLDKKYVFEYRITEDRGFLLSVVSMGIGPAYFNCYDFLDYNNAERFNLDVSKDNIIHNLKLIDEYVRSH